MVKYNLTEDKIAKVLEASYDKAVNGLPGMEIANELAYKYISKANSIDEDIDNFINWQQGNVQLVGFWQG